MHKTTQNMTQVIYYLSNTSMYNKTKCKKHM